MGVKEIMGAITDQWIIKTSGKTEHLLFRQGAIIKPKSESIEKSANDNEMDLIRREIEIIKKIRDLPIDDQEKMFADLEELEILRGNKDMLKERRLEDNQDSTEDEDEDVLKKRRIEDASRYSVLSYHVGSISGDKFMQKLKGNYKQCVNGDSILQAIGASNY